VKKKLGSFGSSRMVISITYIVTKLCKSCIGNIFGKNATCVSNHADHCTFLRGFKIERATVRRCDSLISSFINHNWSFIGIVFPHMMLLQTTGNYFSFD
jgi:hypothetical protein